MRRRPDEGWPSLSERRDFAGAAGRWIAGVRLEFEEFLMSQNGSAGEAKIDHSVPAILRHADRFWPCPTLEDAVAAWHVLPVEMRESASIEVEGAVYRGREIEKLQQKH